MWPKFPDGFESLVKPPANSASQAWYFVRLGDKLACLSERGVPRPIDADAFRWLELEVRAQHYMGQYQGNACFAVDAKGRLPEGYALTSLYDWLGRVENPLFYLAGRAQQIVDWDRTHQFCGVCGTPMEDHDSDRAKVCPNCGHINYPRLSPSIIVLIRRGEQMLLARNANWPNGMFSTLAGFVEPGESVEQALHREVAEEVGLEVENLRYFGSQSWPFPNSLMLGYHADYAAGEIDLCDQEIAEADWFDVHNLPNMPPGTAISRWLIDAFIEEQRGG